MERRHVRISAGNFIEQSHDIVSYLFSIHADSIVENLCMVFFFGRVFVFSLTEQCWRRC